MDLQEKFDAATSQGIIFSILSSGDPSSQTSYRQISGLRPLRGNLSSQEREIAKKGIKRLEKQILQLVSVPRDQSNIALLKKCKTVNVPAANSAIGNIQKALQKYVGFNGMNAVHCDEMGDLMDRAQAWCLDVEELYNKPGVHSSYTSKSNMSDVGVNECSRSDPIHRILLDILCFKLQL